MRKFIWLIFCVALVGCRTQQLSQSPHRHIALSPDTTILPTFPAEALYVLGAQWESDLYTLHPTPYTLPLTLSIMGSLRVHTEKTRVI